MRGLVLANADYSGLLPGSRGHMTDEGHQLQAGLEAAGWVLAGAGYGDGCRDVPTLLDRHKPDVIFVQDVRDWHPESSISFRKDIGFERIEAVGESGIPAYTVLKDAWGWHDLHSRLAEQIKAAGIVHYYHERVIRQVAPWANKYKLHRIYHSVDADLIRKILAQQPPHRFRGIVTGADSPVYPLRRFAREHLAKLGLDNRRHPGYGNQGADTPAYLRWIARYKVHLATASQWEVAFRKIIESVACGCTPVTNLAIHDSLPVIQHALALVSTNTCLQELKDTIDRAEACWDYDERMAWAEAALRYYDWRVAGRRLSAIMGIRVWISSDQTASAAASTWPTSSTG